MKDTDRPEMRAALKLLPHLGPVMVWDDGPIAQVRRALGPSGGRPQPGTHAPDHPPIPWGQDPPGRGSGWWLDAMAADRSVLSRDRTPGPLDIVACVQVGVADDDDLYGSDVFVPVVIRLHKKLSYYQGWIIIPREDMCTTTT